MNRSFLMMAMAICLSDGAVAGRPFPHYRDLNHNGRLDPYEDVRLSAERRARDLVGRMTLEEKVGAMVHGTVPALDAVVGDSATGYDLDKARKLILERHVNNFITRLNMPSAKLAEQNNAIQKIAAEGRLGIPVMLSTDPRNHFQVVLGASSAGGDFSAWPETLGFAALDDADLVRRFADAARREYRAVGITMTLSPQADLATEPRWPRATATFGSDPARVSRLSAAYVEGFQHGASGVATDGVAAVIKHWLGYGAAPEGFDGHNYYGRRTKLTNASFAQHLAAFDGALNSRVAGIMPAYPIITGVTIDGRPLEPVAPGFNRQIISGLLRERRSYRGLVLSDWAITNDCPESCRSPTADRVQRPDAVAMPWGVESLSSEDRFVKAIDAGVDQLGGVNDPAPLLAAARKGRIDRARIDQAVRRIMELKFALGLFDHPFVDVSAAAAIVRNPAVRAEAAAAQRASQVLLKDDGTLGVIPPGTKIWLHGLSETAAQAAGLIPVADPVAAQVALIRISAPFENIHPYAFFGSRQHEGRLDFLPQDAAMLAILKAAAHVPIIVSIDMDRPAILTAIQPLARRMIAVFGASDEAVVDVMTGRAKARGRLPFELPSSMAAVEKQDPAVPDDSDGPLYPVGFGLVD